MISVKELRIGNIVKDKDGNIWRIGCITGMHKDKGSLILERRIDNGTIKWYTSECDVYPISLNEKILDRAEFNDYDNYDYRYKENVVITKNYTLGVVSLYNTIIETDIKGFHHLQNIAYDLYETSLDLNIFDDDYSGDTSLV